MGSSDGFQMDARLKALPSSSSRILDIPCKVCGDYSSGKHYNIFACDGCAGFFKRSIRRNRQYVCKAKEEGTCVVNKLQRNQCRACRLAKCQEAGMNKDAVQHERGPRNATLRRQQQMAAHLFGDPRETMILPPSVSSALDLVIPKPGTTPMDVSPRLTLLPPFMCNPITTTLPRLPFGLTFPPPVPTASNHGAICEQAARLLFINVKWAKSITTLRAFPLSDQLLLLEESWRELFILGSAQFLSGLDFSALVHASRILEKDSEKIATYLQEIKDFQEALTKLSQFQLDAQEMACLRAMCLFKTNFEKTVGTSIPTTSTSMDGKNLSDPGAITAIQDHTQLTLSKYISTTHPGQPLRFGKLLMFLPTLRCTSSETIEELFFRNTIGQIPIEKIICDMYKATLPDLIM